MLAFIWRDAKTEAPKAVIRQLRRTPTPPSSPEVSSSQTHAREQSTESATSSSSPLPKVKPIRTQAGKPWKDPQVRTIMLQTQYMAHITLAIRGVCGCRAEGSNVLDGNSRPSISCELRTSYQRLPLSNTWTASLAQNWRRYPSRTRHADWSISPRGCHYPAGSVLAVCQPYF